MMAYAKMDALTSLLDGIEIGKDADAVAHDVSIMLQCHVASQESMVMHMLPWHMCRMRKGAYKSPQTLYRDIVAEVRARGYEADLLELMPYIDDYIEHFVQGTTS
jgi:hypothetical protein